MIEELKQLIIHNLDVDTFLDLIGLDIADLVDLCEEQVRENYTSLMQAVQ
jgi:hypothetical protein